MILLVLLAASCVGAVAGWIGGTLTARGACAELLADMFEHGDLDPAAVARSIDRRCPDA